jgi:transcriptional regulator with XRE-family HTH domain
MELWRTPWSAESWRAFLSQQESEAQLGTIRQSTQTRPTPRLPGVRPCAGTLHTTPSKMSIEHNTSILEAGRPPLLTTYRYTHPMPTRSKLKLKPVDMGEESLGQRLARLHKQRGWTQKQIAQRTGLIQELVSNYETDKLRLNADMILRFAEVLEVSTDELLRGSKSTGAGKKQPSIKLVRRMEQIEALPLYEQRALRTTIDKFLAAAQD